MPIFQVYDLWLWNDREVDCANPLTPAFMQDGELSVLSFVGFAASGNAELEPDLLLTELTASLSRAAAVRKSP